MKKVPKNCTACAYRKECRSMYGGPACKFKNEITKAQKTK